MTDVLTVDDAVDLRDPRRHRATFVTMLASSLISLLASFVLSIDAVRLAADPEVVLACDISSAISCGAVAQAWQASLFGFPNAFLGLVAEPVVITLAVASLGGTRFPRWFMNAAQVVYFLGLVFAYWLFAQSYFVIGSLCPWCLLVTASTTTVFVSLLRYNLLAGNIPLSVTARARVAGWLRLGADTALVVVVFALLAGAIVVKYHGELF